MQSEAGRDGAGASESLRAPSHPSPPCRLLPPTPHPVLDPPLGSCFPATGFSRGPVGVGVANGGGCASAPSAVAHPPAVSLHSDPALSDTGPRYTPLAPARDPDLPSALAPAV